MKVTAKAAAKVLPPEGVHAARIIRIVDLGTQHDEKFNKDVHKVRLTFELVDAKHVFKEENGEEPFLIDRTYTASLSDKAALKKAIESWRGKFTAKELEEFDLSSLLDTPGQLQVAYNEAESGTTYANISSLMSCPKGMKVSKAANEIFIFDLENYDQAIFDGFPDWMQEMIAESPEYKVAKEGGPTKEEGDSVDELLS